MVEHVARKNFPGDQDRQGHDQPGKGVANPGAYLVDKKK
jgi:hypothetical protein